MGAVMTQRTDETRPSFRLIDVAAMACRWERGIGRPRRRAVALAVLLAVALSISMSPDLRTVGSREALAAGLAERMPSRGYQYGYVAPGSCDKDHYYQEVYTWDDLTSYFTGTRMLHIGTSRNGYCMEKPRTTRPGVQGGNRWDYWEDYWERRNHRNGSMSFGGWWGW